MKKKIVHIRIFYKYYNKITLCGTPIKKSSKINEFIAYSDEKMKPIISSLEPFERLCHKCKRIHKHNLGMKK